MPVRAGGARCPARATATRPANREQQRGGARFALDETKAAEWLGRQVVAADLWIDGDGPAPELEIGGSYCPADDYDGIDTTNLLCAARDAGLITGPGEIWYDHTSGDGETGYVWLVYLTGPGGLKLSSYYEKIKHLGDGSEPGAPAALGVLRDAVSAANGLLDDLAAYVASLPKTAT